MRIFWNVPVKSFANELTGSMEASQGQTNFWKNNAQQKKLKFNERPSRENPAKLHKLKA